MLLTRDNICPYLLEKNWVDAEAAVAGDLAVTAQPTRNNVFKVLQARGRSCFVKQPFAFDQVTTYLIAREARTYALVTTHPAYRATAAALPRLIAHDAELHVLAIEYVPNTTSLHEMILRRRAFFPELAARAGEILASFHGAVPPDVDTTYLPRQPPWVLQLANVPAATFFPQLPSIVAFLQRVQAHPVLYPHLAQLRAEWRGDSLIHGDIKWANFIASQADPEVLRLIDWELADIGDPAWDVAGMFQSYVCAWTFALDERDPAATQLPEAMADFELSKMWPAVRSFWSAYVRGRRFDDATARAFRTKAIRLMACRLIQTAVEGAMRTASIPANSLRTVQVASNILQRPQDAAADLLGL